MVRPKDPYKITLQDLINCGQGDTVISILIDLNGFWTYENREVLASDNSNIELEDPWAFNHTHWNVCFRILMLIILSLIQIGRLQNSLRYRDSPYVNLILPTFYILEELLMLTTQSNKNIGHTIYG